MTKGKIIYLSGVTSTGKTSIARAIQDLSDEFFYLVGSDILMSMVGEKYRLADYEKYEFEMFINMYHFAKLLSDMGKNVIIDCVLFETLELQNHHEKIYNILGDNPLFTVEVACPLEICRQRNIKRGDRGEFQSAEQDKRIDKKAVLDFSVKTDVASPETCAEMILHKLMELFHQ